MAKRPKIDSNITGSRYCQELTLGALDPTPANQTWVEMEPNSYPEFGGEIETIARNPINPGRQRKKGTPVNETATAAYETDVTQTNLQDQLQGFFYADMRFKTVFEGSITVDGTVDNAYDGTGIDSGLFVGDLIFAGGKAPSASGPNAFSTAANNGLKTVTAVATDTVEVAETLVDEGPVTARLECVGFQFPTGDASLVAAAGGEFPYLLAATKDVEELGLIPGEWVFVGGDETEEQFALNAPFFARVREVTDTGRIYFDKTSVAIVPDDGTSTGSGGAADKTIRLFKGRVIKNEIGSDIVRRSYAFERTLGSSDDADATKEQAEYVHGSVPNELTITAEAAAKLIAELAFVGLRTSQINENDDGDPDLLSKVAGVVRVPVEEADMFNTSSDVTRIRLSTVVDGDSLPDPLFTYAESLTLTINNNNSPNNAIGVFGAFEVTAGTFEAGGEVNAYFGDVEAVRAVRNNADVTIDAIFVKDGAGMAFDVPLISLGNGRLEVEQDEPVMIPLELNAATAAKIDPTLNHTLLFVFFPSLPEAAE